MLQWDCHDCPFTAWGQTAEAVEQLIARHTVDHNRETLRDVDAGVAWSCPHCASTGYDTEFQAAVRGFREHVRNQHMHQFELLDRDVSAELDGGGGILIDTAPASEEAATAVTYAHHQARTSIVITSRPEAHVQHLDRNPAALPDSLSIITTQPVTTDEFETTTLTAERMTVIRPTNDSLGALGESLSQTLSDAETDDQPVCIEMDIFPEMLDNFPATTVFQFTYTLCQRARQSGAVVYFFLDTATRADKTVETFSELFALELTATEAGVARTGLKELSSFE